MTFIRPLPEIDGLAKYYWEAAARERLLVQKCFDCKMYQHYARPICTHCGGVHLEFIEASQKATVLSCTTIYKSPYDDLKIPYVLALVRLEEGVTILSHIIDAVPNQNYCDVPVVACFEEFREKFKLPVFRLAIQN